MRPSEELGRLGELGLDVELSDDEGVVDQRGRCNERTRMAQAPGAVESRRRDLSGARRLVGEVQHRRQTRLQLDRDDRVAARLCRNGAFEQGHRDGIVGAVRDAQIGAWVGVAERCPRQQRWLVGERRGIDERLASRLDVTHVAVSLPDEQRQLGSPARRRVARRDIQRPREPDDRLLVGVLPHRCFAGTGCEGDSTVGVEERLSCQGVVSDSGWRCRSVGSERLQRLNVSTGAVAGTHARVDRIADQLVAELPPPGRRRVEEMGSACLIEELQQWLRRHTMCRSERCDVARRSHHRGARHRV